MNHTRRVTRLALTAAALLAALTAPLHAQVQPDLRANVYTQGDFALLPEWCIDSQDGPYGSPEGGEYLNKSPRARQWVSLMGPDFWHMHHYCRGLKGMLRLRGTGIPPLRRTALMQSTIGEFAYVINNCGPKMPLLPEVYLKQGEVYLMMNDLAAAQFSFEKSRELKPDYWPAYDRWLAVLIDLKRWDTARELAQEGLRQSPAQPNLVARLAAIDAGSGRKSGGAKSAAASTGDAPR